jgi:hypothetical protein
MCKNNLFTAIFETKNTRIYKFSIIFWNSGTTFTVPFRKKVVPKLFYVKII